MSVSAVWFEIPSINFERAVAFYESMFEVKLNLENIGGRLAMFPAQPPETGGAIVEAQPGYVPSATGPAIYLHGGDDLNGLLDRAVKAGGKVLVPRTALPPGMGFFAHFQDTEGNRVGLHSMN